MVTFDLGNGTTCAVQNNAQLLNTTRGLVRADQVTQGDRICPYVGGPYLEVVAPPVVS